MQRPQFSDVHSGAVAHCAHFDGVGWSDIPSPANQTLRTVNLGDAPPALHTRTATPTITPTRTVTNTCGADCDIVLRNSFKFIRILPGGWGLGTCPSGSLTCAVPGAWVEISIRCINSGGAPATDVTVSDDLDPAAFDLETLCCFSAPTPAINPAGSELVWQLGTLGPGSSAEVSFSVRLRSSLVCAMATNSAKIGADELNSPVIVQDKVEVGGCPPMGGWIPSLIPTWTRTATMPSSDTVTATATATATRTVTATPTSCATPTDEPSPTASATSVAPLAAAPGAAAW